MAHKVTSANEPNPLTGKRLSSCPLTRSGVTEVAQIAGRTPKMEDFVPWTVDNAVCATSVTPLLVRGQLDSLFPVRGFGSFALVTL